MLALLATQWRACAAGVTAPAHSLLSLIATRTAAQRSSARCVRAARNLASLHSVHVNAVWAHTRHTCCVTCIHQTRIRARTRMHAHAGGRGHLGVAPREDHQHYWSAAQNMSGAAAGLAVLISQDQTSIELIGQRIAGLGRQRVPRPSFRPMLWMLLVLCFLLPHDSNAQESGCAATPGTYESATSTIVCGSLTSSPPTCEVVFSSLPASTGLSSFFITIEIANSDFGSSNEYVSAVLVGGQTLGTDFLKDDGTDNQCNKMSRILDLTAVPIGAVSSAGDLTVRIEASLGVNANECDGSYLYGRVKLTTCTGGISQAREMSRECACAHTQKWERARTCVRERAKDERDKGARLRERSFAREWARKRERVCAQEKVCTLKHREKSRESKREREESK